MSGNKFFSWLRSLSLCLTLVAPTVTHAADTFGVNELMHTLAQVKSSRATFVERKYLSLMYAPLESSGTLLYTAPGRVEKYTLLPKAESMVLEQDSLIVEGGAAGKRRVLPLREYPVAWAFVESFRSTLAGDVQTLNRFYQVKLEGQPKQWLLILKPIEPKMKYLVSEIRIAGSEAHIATIEVWEKEGDHSVMTIRKDNS
ncbi:MAG TPA: LolA-related protein, partial [Gammaproteobacteria bacterium]